MHHNSLLVITGIERDGVNLAANPVFAWVQIDFRTTLKRLCPSSCGTDGKPVMRQCRVMILSLRSLMRFPGAGKEASRSSFTVHCACASWPSVATAEACQRTHRHRFSFMEEIAVQNAALAIFTQCRPPCTTAGSPLPQTATRPFSAALPRSTSPQEPTLPLDRAALVPRHATTGEWQVVRFLDWPTFHDGSHPTAAVITSQKYSTRRLTTPESRH